MSYLKAVCFPIKDEKNLEHFLINRFGKELYFGSYDRFDELRSYLDGHPNLFLVGRNGMHRYNNQDHSMLTAITAVDNIIAGITTKDNIWSVNTEQEYHESKSE